MGILTRLADLSKAAINEALDKLEQPEMMMNQYVRNMQEELEALQRAAAREEAEHARLKRMIEYYNRSAEDCERKAAEALTDGRNAEARRSIEEKLTVLEKAAECAQAYEGSLARLSELNQQLELAKSKYSEMQAKRDDLAKRVQKTQTEARSMAGAAYSYGIETGSAARGFERIEESIRRREMEMELENAERKAAEAARSAMVEEQLARLKNEVSAK
jgi:phage shock protein A